jgi:hypothetical protein
LGGEGTSAATPQVAAAAALWLEKYKNELPRDWRRIEAVRHALFTTAKNKGADPKRIGRGILQAFAALGVKPVLGLKQTQADNDSFAFLRVITGIGVAEAPPREQMFNLELAQRWLVNRRLQEIVPDPEATARVDEATLAKLMEAAPEFAVELGLDPAKKFEVHELRRAMRVGPDGRHVPQVVVALTQSKVVKEDQRADTPRYFFRGGSTLIVDLSIPAVKYRIVKNINSDRRQDRTAAFVREVAADPLRALFFSPDQREPFAALHSLAGEGF